jgi:hypothetical protein
MFTARQAKEIVVEVRNDVGVLHEMVRIIADRGVNILAVHGSCEDQLAVIRLVTEDNLRAVDALLAKNYQPQERSVIQVDMPHKPGMLRAMTEKLAREDIDINHLYASAGMSDSRCTLVMSTSDNERAIVALNR